MVHLIGIDIGTTGTKALLIDRDGRIIARSTIEYPLSQPKLGWAEQDPGQWWGATINTIKRVIFDSRVDPNTIKGIGLSGQMHGAVFIDRDFNVLRPCILWCDQRTDAECKYITEKIGKKRLINLTCNPALTGFTAPKILWVRKHEPEVYNNTYKILLPKDYIRFKLTGEFATDVSDASGTLLFDVKNRHWSKEMLKGLDIDMDLMAKSLESYEITGRITEEVASETGLIKGTPVVGGAGDQAAGAVGNGIVSTGVISATIGTSGVVFAYSNQPKVDPLGRLHTFCHAVPGKWHLMGVMLSAGGSFRWFRDTLADSEVLSAREEGIDPYEVLTHKGESATPGCQGLIFLPYLTGERTPHANPNARGVLFGLNLRHGKPDIIRSIMEGVVYGMRDSLEIIKELKVAVNEIRVSGGGARSRLWRQIQADVYNKTITMINVDEGPAFGVALLAGVGTGIYKSVEEACKKTIKVAEKVKPTPDNVKTYEEIYRIYQRLYHSLKDRFDEVAEVG